MTTACNGEIAMMKSAPIVIDEQFKQSLKATFSSLPELPASFIKANANPRLPRLLGTDRDVPSREESIAELKASLLPASRAAKPLSSMKSPGGMKSLGGMKRISSKVSISDMVESWEIPLPEDEESLAQAPTKTMKAVKAEQPPSLRPRHVRNAEETGCCAAGLKRAIRFVFFGF